MVCINDNCINCSIFISKEFIREREKDFDKRYKHNFGVCKN